MKTHEGIDDAFRPKSYWADTSVAQALVRDVKGSRRREMIDQAFASGQIDQVDEVLLEPEVSTLLRTHLGRIHPSFMGGEYLPGYHPHETEIARIQLRSTTWDVISIRAQWLDGRIHYRVVDEYGGRFQCRPSSSRHPFSLRSFIRFIDQVYCPDLTRPFSLAYNEYNAEYYTTRRELRHFTRISSSLYPKLEAHFERVFEDWVEEGEEEASEAGDGQTEG